MGKPLRAAIACATTNRKLTRKRPGIKRRAYATHASLKSCPADCPLIAGCYAKNFPQMIHTNRLTRSRVITPEEIAQQEADAIRALPSDPFAAMLRLHVVGDATTARAAETIARAAEDWRARCNDAPPYGYTHAWRTVPRAAWRSVSMLASVEDEAGALAAIARDYAPAIVVPNFTSARASITPAGLRVVPCPAITRGKTCDECRLCFDDRALLERRAVIAFEAHGARARSVRAALVQPC